uniref:Uncharacterized protein n=1 Tax=Caenorhabditis japonica TaxID=281687 RepID=A0A8R1IJD9_CAEJA
MQPHLLDICTRKSVVDVGNMLEDREMLKDGAVERIRCSNFEDFPSSYVIFMRTSGILTMIKMILEPVIQEKYNIVGNTDKLINLTVLQIGPAKN